VLSTYRISRAQYAQAYSALALGPFTPQLYFTRGLFLFIIVTWMSWEALSGWRRHPFALRKLKPYQLLIEG
jgi:hypothetical protein